MGIVTMDFSPLESEKYDVISSVGTTHIQYTCFEPTALWRVARHDVSNGLKSILTKQKRAYSSGQKLTARAFLDSSLLVKTSCRSPLSHIFWSGTNMI